MIDFIIVDEATMFPHTCALCEGQSHKPFLDGIKEIAGIHVYICKQCGRRISQAFGFAESEQLDKLMNAREALDASAREIGERTEMLAARDAEIERLRRDLSLTQEELDTQNQRGAQLQARLEQIRADTLATIDSTSMPEQEAA